MNKQFLGTLVLAGVVMASAQETTQQVAAQEAALANKEASLSNETSVLKAKIDSINEVNATLDGKLKALEEDYLDTKSTVNKLSKIKISGYTQFQYRAAVDTVANTAFDIGTYQGGALPTGKSVSGSQTSSVSEPTAPGVTGIYQIRRNRLKAEYEGDNAKGVFEIDALPTSFQIKDAYAQFNDPWIKAVGVKAGSQDRPFGFEGPYSSSALEFSERTRGSQIFNNNEKDLGVNLYFKPSEKLPDWAQYLDLQVGLFGGSGINYSSYLNPSVADQDDGKDLIGRLGYKIPIQELNAGISGGFSIYRGTVQTPSDSVYTWSVTNSKYAGQSQLKAARQAYNADMQVTYDIPYIGGLALRGEYTIGRQPGTASSSSLYVPGQLAGLTNTPIKDSLSVTTTNGNVSKASLATNSTPITVTNTTAAWVAVYNREFASGYLAAILNVGKSFQFAYRYDEYMPNYNINKNEIANAADLAWYTHSFGLSYFYGPIKLSAFYDIVENETVAAGQIKGDVYTRILPDNVLTLRVQYKF